MTTYALAWCPTCGCGEAILDDETTDRTLWVCRDCGEVMGEED